MPAKSPRVQVTVTEEQHALLLELGRMQGRSASSYFREMLDTITPTLRHLVPLLRDATETIEQAEWSAVLASLKSGDASHSPELDLPLRRSRTQRSQRPEGRENAAKGGAGNG